VRSMLIIDADLGFAGSLADMLRPKGYTAWCADTPERALAVLRDPPDGGSPPQVALIGEGVGAITTLIRLLPSRSARWELVCVLMAADLPPSQVERLRLSGIDYFDKSWDLNTLIAVLDRCFDQLAARGQIAPERDRRRDELVKTLRLDVMDKLTGVANVHSLFDALRAAIADVDSGGAQASLVLFDVDDMKTVNDRAGHATGDALLREVAQSLRDGLRESELVGRIGGDEFVAVLRCGGAEARARARALALALPLPVSWGMVYLKPGCTSEGVVQEADAGMFAMKRGRRRPR
jgi:diguanylate cyclase (GGDEF)-like protein